MKLSAHYNKASIIITITVLFAGAVVYFFTIDNLGRSQLDDNLREEVEEVVDYVNINGKLPKQVDFDEDITTFVKTDKTQIPLRFFDTVYNNLKEKKAEDGRAVSGIIPLKNEHYFFTIIVSKEGTEYLIQVIGLITLALTIILLLILTITNKYILNGLWKPFYETLNTLKAFNISDNQKLRVNTSKVDEFNDLNQAVQTMSSRVKSDYQHLKHFTENASHEMMTPLAVITSKLDTLIQDEELKPEQYEQINDIYSAAAKLSRLNQSLLLLVKIENNLIDDAENLDLAALVTQKVRQFQELILNKNLIITEHIEPKMVFASKYLMDNLLNNMVSNAIRHNINGGYIKVSLSSAHLIFENTGSPAPLNSDTLFKRFQKGQKSEGMGLGLTIVKNICNLYNWEISYKHSENVHSFQITF
jgi:signal transduction histidine kinase